MACIFLIGLPIIITIPEWREIKACTSFFFTPQVYVNAPLAPQGTRMPERHEFAIKEVLCTIIHAHWAQPGIMLHCTFHTTVPSVQNCLWQDPKFFVTSGRYLVCICTMLKTSGKTRTSYAHSFQLRACSSNSYDICYRYICKCYVQICSQTVMQVKYQ